MVPDDQLDFQAVWTRRPLFTYIFFGLNLLIFLLMTLAGGSTNEATLMAFGVKHNGEIAQGQWWRFVTPIFIHIGVLHLLFNSYALWIVGPQVEKLYGPARFVILYVLTGVAGVYASYFYHPFTISAGASGAIFGLFGVLFMFGIRYRNSIPTFFKQAVGTGVLPVIVINLIIGFMIPAVDNSAHIGGLLAGAALAALVPFQKPGEESTGSFRAVQMALLAMIVVCFYEVIRNYDGPNPSVRNLRSIASFGSRGSPVDGYNAAINESKTAFEESLDALESGRVDQLASVKARVTASIDKLSSIPSLSARTDQLADDLRRVMQDQYQLIQDVERSGVVTLIHSRRLKENAQMYYKILSELSQPQTAPGR